MKNYELYARILRLFTDHEEDSERRRLPGSQSMREIVCEVVYIDADLVWC